MVPRYFKFKSDLPSDSAENILKNFLRKEWEMSEAKSNTWDSHLKDFITPE